MPDFLFAMAAASRTRVKDAKSRRNEAALLGRVHALPEAPPWRHHPSGFELIAELKPRSPSGAFFATANAHVVRARGDAYARGGACVVSVLTEPDFFGGSLDTLAQMASSCGLPCLRKDFLVDPYQVLEARAFGAAGVLLIIRLLDDRLLEEMIAAADAVGLFVLLEAFDAEELDRASRALAGAPIVGALGVNARNLQTLAVDANRHAELAARAPGNLPLVAESGIATPDDAARVARLGYGAALVGEALMRSGDPERLLAEMLASGRKAASQTEDAR
jgi:indole-3-glycerol phosphate synthase